MSLPIGLGTKIIRKGSVFFLIGLDIKFIKKERALSQDFTDSV